MDSEIVDQQIRLIDTSQKKNGLALNRQHVNKKLLFHAYFLNIIFLLSSVIISTAEFSYSAD